MCLGPFLNGWATLGLTACFWSAARVLFPTSLASRLRGNKSQLPTTRSTKKTGEWAFLLILKEGPEQSFPLSKRVLQRTRCTTLSWRTNGKNSQPPTPCRLLPGQRERPPSIWWSREEPPA